MTIPQKFIGRPIIAGEVMKGEKPFYIMKGDPLIAEYYLTSEYKEGAHILGRVVNATAYSLVYKPSQPINPLAKDLPSNVAIPFINFQLLKIA